MPSTLPSAPNTAAGHVDLGMLEQDGAARVGGEIIFIDREAAGLGVGDDDAAIGVADEADHVDDAVVVEVAAGLDQRQRRPGVGAIDRCGCGVRHNRRRRGQCRWHRRTSSRRREPARWTSTTAPDSRSTRWTLGVRSHVLLGRKQHVAAGGIDEDDVLDERRRCRAASSCGTGGRSWRRTEAELAAAFLGSSTTNRLVVVISSLLWFAHSNDWVPFDGIRIGSCPSPSPSVQTPIFRCRPPRAGRRCACRRATAKARKGREAGQNPRSGSARPPAQRGWRASG